MTASFGAWISQRRKSRHLTQRELAATAACAVATIKKIEADERRPSAEMAGMLGEALGVPDEWKATFIACARGQKAVENLQTIGIQASHTTLTTLPALKSPLIGREHDLAEIIDLLSQPACRLLTLVGQGGIGKTRLALEIAHRLSTSFEAGTVFVPLAPVTHAENIAPAMIQSLGLSMSDEAQLFAYLHDQALLLVLDNCEQLGAEVAWFSHLLSHVPHIKLLATSRERLQLAEEWIYTVAELEKAPAITLFAQCALRAQPGVSVSEEEASAICDLVANLPLAVELAASWLPTLSAAQIAEHIQQDIDFLATNVRNMPERHRSIRAVFDHSWQLLSERERNALMRLSVFRGGWMVDTAQAVADANLPLLRALVEKSLVRVHERYDLHELTRQYAADKLRDAGLEHAARDAHLQAFIQMAHDFTFAIGTVKGTSAKQRNDAEMDNFRAALQWAVDSRQAELGMCLMAYLFIVWIRRGYWQEGEMWNRELQAVHDGQDSKWLCMSLVHYSTFVALQGRYREAGPVIKRGQAMAYRLQDPEALMSFYETYMEAVGDLETASEAFHSAEQIMLAPGNEKWSGRLAGLYTRFGDRLRENNRLDEATALYEKSLAMHRANGDDGGFIAYPLGNLGRVALLEGRLDDAYAYFSEAVHMSRLSGTRVGIADWLQQLGKVLVAMGDFDQAEICMEEAYALYEEMGNRRAAPDLIANLGIAALMQDRDVLAADYFRESLRRYHAILSDLKDVDSPYSKPHSWDMLHCLLGVSMLAYRNDDLARAVTIYAKTLTFVDNTLRYGQRDDAIFNMAEKRIEAIRAALPPAKFHAAEAYADSLSNMDFIAYTIG